MSEETGGTVLILEDDPGVARLERLRLERAGFAVVAAANAAEAFAALRAGGVDLMVLDYRLGGDVSGLDIHSQIRDAGLGVPAILVTGFGDETILAEALRAGIRDFLPKTPDYLDVLATIVGRVMTQVETERALAARQSQLDGERHRSRQLRRLAAISSGLNAALDVDGVLRILTVEARGLVGARQSIASLVPEGDWSRAGHAVSPEDGAPYPLPDGRGEAAEVCVVGLPRRVDNGSRAAPAPAGWLAVPLIGRQGRCLGLVQLFDKADGPFTGDDEAILLQLAQMASIAVENARLYQELRNNDRRKDEFLAMLAHELRNPLAAIDGAVQVCRQDRGADHFDWATDVIGRQTGQLSRLIDDLLDVTRINQGKVRLRKEALNLSVVAVRAVEAVRSRVVAKGHAVEVDLPDEPLWVEADPARLEQVIVNLLGNAVKYTPEGGRIELAARREGEEVVVEVADNGLGLSPEMIPRIFDQFLQVEETLDRAQGGLGIGLTLVRRLLEMHDGTVSARSDGPGKGSVFAFRLPAIAAPIAEAAAPVVALDEPARRKSWRILVVDDNDDALRAMGRILGLSGHEVHSARDGVEALDVALSVRPEVVLLDIGLPRLDGYQVAARLRAEPATAGVTLVAVSGFAAEAESRRSTEAGFDFHMVKPIDFEDLFARLDSRPDQVTG